MTFSTLRLRRLRALIVAKVLLFWFFFSIPAPDKRSTNETFYPLAQMVEVKSVSLAKRVTTPSTRLILDFFFFGTLVVIKLAANCYKKVNFSTVTSPQQTSSVAFSRLNKKWCNLLCEATTENSVQVFPLRRSLSIRLSRSGALRGCCARERATSTDEGKKNISSSLFSLMNMRLRFCGGMLST